MTIAQTLQWLSQKLYPTGRVFRMPEGSIFYRLPRAINLQFARTYGDAVQILNDILPDNPSFTIDDAHDWYRRLGIYDSGSVPLADMKLAIAQKLSFPVTPLNKQNYLYIQGQLRAAGFDVYVYENRFPNGMGGYETRTPAQVLGASASIQAMYGFIQYGQTQYGRVSPNQITKIANYIEEVKDASFNVGSNYRSTFYIAGATVDAFTTVPASRKIEFRQLTLKLKPAQTMGFLFVNYI